MAKKRYKKRTGKSMTVAQAMLCAVKIFNGKTCSAAEQRAAMKTLGWAVKVGRLTQRKFKR